MPWWVPLLSFVQPHGRVFVMVAHARRARPALPVPGIRFGYSGGPGVAGWIGSWRTDSCCVILAVASSAAARIECRMDVTFERSPQGGRAGCRMVLVFVVAEVVFIATSVLALALAALSGYSAPGDMASPAALLTALSVPGLLAALVALAGTGVLGAGPYKGRIRRELAVLWSWRAIGLGLLIGVVGLVLSLPAAALWAQWVGPNEAESALGEAFRGKQLGLPAAVSAFMVVWLLAPVYEELLFRGVLWRAFEHWRWNGWAILAGTTVLFSVAHLEPLRTPLLLVLSIPVGVARLMTDNLLSAIVAHQVNNLLPAFFLFFLVSG